MSRDLDLMDNCPICGAHNWIDYANYLECADCGHTCDEDNEEEE